MKEIVLDTETTGLLVKDGHRIVEIGCIELDDLIPTKKIFHFYLNPERKVSEEALKVHGYSDKFLSDKKKFAEIADDFLEFIKDKKVIIHNADFDIAHINNELLLCGENKIDNEIVDTLKLARDKFPGSQVSLDALFDRAAALRAVELVEPRSVIGKTTMESLQSGAVYGFAAQVDGMVSRFRDELGDCNHNESIIQTTPPIVLYFHGTYHQILIHQMNLHIILLHLYLVSYF